VEPVPARLPRNYHNGSTKVELSDREFIAWDGEGMQLRRKGLPQSYVLFGASTGEVLTGENLTCFQLLDHIIAVGRRNPTAVHVGFAFTYDANMIVKSLGDNSLAWLHKFGYVNVGNRITGLKYCVMMRKGKWFSVTQYQPGYDREHNPHAKYTVRIFDVFSFFACSGIEAITRLLGSDAVKDIVQEGKDRRGSFQWEDMPFVEQYWRAEIGLYVKLVEELRKRLYAGGFKIREWHGPGAIASYVLKQRGIKRHMTVCPDPVREAGRYGFAAGRFELYGVGRWDGPVYGIDRNSAYPFAISQLPSLSEGQWIHVKSPDHISHFGIYHVRVSRSAGFDFAAGPLFHRDSRHNISYPWLMEGWYWSPEVAGIIGQPGVEIIEGWEYVGWKTLPFEFFKEWYAERRAKKDVGDQTELGDKLGMNSVFGKMAQRVGWDEFTQRVPPWHQLEWAGWITSHCRAAMYRLMLRIPHDKLIGVETDGVYTTAEPGSIGVQHGTGLGEWDVTRWDEVMYVQSGLAWLRKGDKWTSKRRGLDKNSFQRDECEQYLRSLDGSGHWKPFVGHTTRFITLGTALASSAPLKVRHCQWETRSRDIWPGEHGKRIHVGGDYCAACRAGATAYEIPHQLAIRSRSRAGDMSTAHVIPWEGRDTGAVEWRDYPEEGEVMYE